MGSVAAKPVLTETGWPAAVSSTDARTDRGVQADAAIARSTRVAASHPARRAATLRPESRRRRSTRNIQASTQACITPAGPQYGCDHAPKSSALYAENPGTQNPSGPAHGK